MKLRGALWTDFTSDNDASRSSHMAIAVARKKAPALLGPGLVWIDEILARKAMREAQRGDRRGFFRLRVTWRGAVEGDRGEGYRARYLTALNLGYSR